MFEPLLLANPDIPTLRHQCSRARTVHPRTSTASPYLLLAAMLPVRSDFKRGCSRVARGIPLFASALAEAYGRAGPWRLELARDHWWRSVGMSGFARRRGSSVRQSGEHRAIYVPKAKACTLGTLTRPWWEGVFFASFLCRRWTKK